MPVTYALVGPLLKLDLEGRYKPRDIVEQFLAGLADPSCPSEVALLVDVTRSQSLETRAPREIRHIAQFLGRYRARIGGRCAVVAKTDVHFGLSKMGSAYSEAVGVRAAVFRDSRSALDWLGVHEGN